MARRGGKTSAIKGEDYTFFDLDSDALCRPSDLLIGGNVGHNFKHIETDFTPLQQRVMNKVLLAKKKRKQVENSREKITALQNQAASAAAEGQNQITAAMRKLREDLTRVEENMRSELARITAMNEAALNPQLQLCDSVLADLDEGVFLAKNYLESENPDCKPLSVVQSIEVGINEIVETNVDAPVKLKKVGKIDVGAASNRLLNVKLPVAELSGDTSAAGSRAKPAKAYERLHNLSIRRRVEDVNLPAPQVRGGDTACLSEMLQQTFQISRTLLFTYIL